jgi:hypothetical protein
MRALDPAMTSRTVVPAQAGTQFLDEVAKRERLDSGLRRNDDRLRAN